LLPKWLALASAISVTLAVILNIVKLPLIAIFTRDAAIAGIAAAVLSVAIVYEPGRSLNTVVIPALKGAGDVRFPVAVGAVFMWGVSVSGAWFLGRVLGLGLLGVWIAMCTDEWLRGLFMLGRWRSGRWRKGS
jgi:Na+-driven multidrug efflux pump